MPKKRQTGPSKNSASYLTNGAYITRLRERTGRTQLELADRSEVVGTKIGHRTIVKAEAGKEPVHQKTIANLAELFSNDPDINQPIHWHDLVAECEKDRLVVQPVNVPSNEPSSAPLSVSAVPDFTGRTKELADIARHLQSGKAVCITAIKAAGGMGKTWLARKAAEELASRFPGGTLLVELDGMENPVSTATAMQDVIRKLIPATSELPAEIELLRGIYLHLLKWQKWLLILDNAADAEQVAPLLKDLPPSVSVIITSRKRISLPEVMKQIDLEVMASDDAVKMLDGIVKETRPDLNENDLTAIAGKCGYLPLALRVAGTMLRDNKMWTRKRFEDALEKEPLRHLNLKTDEYNVGRVLSLSVRQLIEDDPERARRFQMLSVFPATFALDAAMAVWDLDEDGAFTELNDLHGRSLIEWDETTDRYRLHDLIRHVARDPFPADHPLAATSDERLGLAERRFAEHYMKVLPIANDAHLVEGLAVYDLEIVNMDAGRSWTERYSATDADVAKLYCRYALNGAGLYRYRLSPSERVLLYQRCLEITQKMNWREDEANAKLNLGEALATMGEGNLSWVICQEAGATFAQCGNERGWAAAMGRIADIFFQRGDLDAALLIRREIELPTFERLGDEREKAVTMSRIADIFLRRGELDEALRISRELLPVCEQLGDERGRAVTLGRIGDIFFQRGELAEALRIYRDEVLLIFQRLGDERGRAATMVRIADIFHHRGQFDEALRIHREELPLSKRLGDTHSLIVVRSNIGITLLTAPSPSESNVKEGLEHLQWAMETADRHRYAEADQIRQIWQRLRSKFGQGSPDESTDEGSSPSPLDQD